MTPYKYFKMFFFSNNIFDHLSKQTNLYTMQQTGVPINTTANEMEQFVGIHILSGIVKMPSYRMYWSDSCRFSPIADVMLRTRFDKLRSGIHLNDNSNMVPKEHPSYDPLFKIRPVLTLVKENLRDIPAEEHHSVDEMIVPFKGRSSLKQYNKSKPHKWGIKVFVRAGKSGMVYDFEVYVGKGTTKTSSPLGEVGTLC